MAAETPGGERAKQKRRSLSWHENRNADKYYASGDRSVINNSAADSKQRPGETPEPIFTPLLRDDDRSADKYYRADNRHLGAQPPRAERRRAVTVIGNAGHVHAVLSAAVDRVRSGQSRVVVTVATGRADLLRRVRAALDMLVTREELSEDEARNIRFSYADILPARRDSSREIVAPPEPAGTKEANPPLLEDPLDFLMRDAVEADDTIYDTAPRIDNVIDGDDAGRGDDCDD